MSRACRRAIETWCGERARDLRCVHLLCAIRDEVVAERARHRGAVLGELLWCSLRHRDAKVDEVIAKLFARRRRVLGLVRAARSEHGHEQQNAHEPFYGIAIRHRKSKPTTIPSRMPSDIDSVLASVHSR